MRLREVTLQAPAGRVDELKRFYERLLERPAQVWDGSAAADEAPVSFQIGWSRLDFGPARAGDSPWHHFALLVPADRMEEALEWAIVGQRLSLRSFSDDPADLVMKFSDWGAHSVYFHDPVGNVVELIAHSGFGENGRTGAFHGGELLGISEIGLVGNPEGVAVALGQRLGLSVFQGDLDTLAFVGEPTAALLLTEAGRPWMHGPAAEPWPAVVTVDDVPGRGWAAAGVHQVSVAEEDR